MEKVIQTPSLETLKEQARIYFNSPTTEKEITRRAQLKANPELKLRLNLQGLRKIIDFQDFLCHPRCSIARDEAIEGSDIDSGMIITVCEVDEIKQLEFVKELRRQGFSVYILREMVEAEEKLKSVSNDNTDRTLVEKLRQQCEKMGWPLYFVTEEYIKTEAGRAKNLTLALAISFTGKSIPRVYHE